MEDTKNNQSNTQPKKPKFLVRVLLFLLAVLVVLGAVAVVTQEIDNRSATGQVKVSGQIWTARSQGEDPIPVGTSVTVLRIEGVKLIVQAKAPVPV